MPTPEPPPTITRRPGPIPLDGIQIRCLGDLRNALPGTTPRDWLVSDLVLGSWRGHWLGRELCRQLGLATPVREAELEASHHLGSYADAIGDFVDAETRGDRRIQIALDTASRLLAHLAAGPARCILVLGPRFGMPWEAEDEDLLAFLAQGLAGQACRLVVVATGEDAAPLSARFEVRWRQAASPADGAPPAIEPIRLVPGLIDAELATVVDATAALDGPGLMQVEVGLWLQDPALRPDPRQVPRLAMTRLAAGAGKHGWLSAYGHCHGIDSGVDLKCLLHEGRRRAREWSGGTARRCFDRAIECAASPGERAHAAMMAQGPYITLFQFDALAAMPDPPPQAPPPFRGYYLQNKAWGLVMTGQAARAKELFDQALELLAGGGDSREYLYLMNISALSLLRSGQTEAALERELEIRARLQHKSPPDWHVEYINALNIARLHHYRRDFELAERELRRAFETTEGLRSQADLIYQSFYLGRSLEARGRRRQAAPHWLRGALYWVSHPAPETLPVRVARLICERSDNASERVEAMSSSWLRILGQDPERSADDGPEPPVFVDADDLPTGAFDAACGAPGWAVLTSKAPRAAAWDGPHTRQLRRLLHQRLVQGQPRLAAARCLAIDARLGRGMATSTAELLAVGLRRGVRRVAFGGRALTLDRNTRRDWEATLRARRSPAVADITDGEAPTVVYRRYRRDRPLSEDEAWLVGRLQGTLTVAALLGDRLDQPGPRRALRRLEDDRVLQLDLPEDVMAGPRPAAAATPPA